MFEVEDGHPVPEGRSHAPAFPFSEMSVGQSFTVPVEMHARVATASSKYGKANDMKFSVRKIGPRGAQTQSRCWRTA